MQNPMVADLVQICRDYPQYKIDFQLISWETDFLRFFQSQTNYNITKHIRYLYVTLHEGKKGYGFNITDPHPALIRQRLDEAAAVLADLSEDPDFVDLEDDLTMAPDQPVPDNITNVTLDKKLDLLTKLATAVEPLNFTICGTFICNRQESWRVTSNGMAKCSKANPIMLEVKAVEKGTEVTVLEAFGSEDFARLDQEALTKSLVQKAKAATMPVVDVEPDHYTVVLAPRCIGELISYLVGAGFFAASLDQGSSFFEGKLNQQVFPAHITLQDDPRHPGVLGQSYNQDGHIYRPLTLIDKGVFKTYLVDNYYSHKLNMPKTGAMGECLVLEPGDKTVAEMIGGIKHGLFISSLHYMNYINPKETSITGLTRDGTFLIEDGKITNVVNNLRFTVKISDVLENITALEKTLHSVPFSQNYDEFSISAVAMPHVVVEKFNITSSTHTI